MQKRSSSMKLFAAIGFAATWFAVIFQYYLLVNNNDGGLLTKTVQFISYFTILTNTIATIYYTTVLFGNAERKYWLTSPATATAIAVYITIVGLVYNVILRFTWNPQGWQKLVDELLHTFNPLFFIFFWWMFVPKQNLKWKNAFPWLLYPLIYFIYVLVRGAIVSTYPYPFVDVGVHGYGKVLVNSVVILLVFVFFSFLFIWLAKLKKSE